MFGEMMSQCSRLVGAGTYFVSATTSENSVYRRAMGKVRGESEEGLPLVSYRCTDTGTEGKSSSSLPHGRAGDLFDRHALQRAA